MNGHCLRPRRGCREPVDDADRDAAAKQLACSDEPDRACTDDEDWELGHRIGLPSVPG
jgi:hypothetical protein